MTVFDLRSLSLRPGEQHRETLELELEPLSLGGQRYRPEPAVAAATLTIDRAGSGLVFRLALTLALTGPCMRCLEDASLPLAIDASEYQASSPDSEELRTPYLADDLLDLSAWARDAVALALPDRILCREDCAGLCAGCGASLNREPCRCPPPAPDPRFAKLAGLKERLEADAESGRRPL
ncbi:MAG: DUF177 domain-containing protein [Thermoleophilia bacterium]|nr:DUF177 domain-containing protein [Thermoleophilia bacterium]